MHLEGKLITEQSWNFLSRFCFLSDIGRMEYKFSYAKGNRSYNILLYYDSGHQWKSVYLNKSKSCIAKEKVLQPSTNQVINLTLDYKWSNCRINVTNDMEDRIVCTGGRSFRSLHEQWWYIAISNCHSNLSGIELDYKLQLTNGESFWTKHFSADEFGILETDIIFLILFFIMFILSTLIAHSLQGRQMFHLTYKLFMVCLFFEVFGLLNICISLGIYASDGVGDTTLKYLGLTSGVLAEIIFLNLLLLLANGFTVTRGRLSRSGTIKLFIFMILFIVINSTLFVYEFVFSDPGLVLYAYESSAGVGVIILRFASWVWFTQAILMTLKHYPEKQNFYFPLYGVYSIWFFSQPLMVLIAANLIPKYMRAKLVNAIHRLIDLSAYFFFLSLMRPQNANKNFPYHVRTTQIDIVDTSSHNFPHCVYQSTSSQTTSNHITSYDIFTVQNNTRLQVNTETEEPPPPYEKITPNMVEMLTVD